MIEIFLFISVLGLLGMTWLFPLLAGICAQSGLLLRKKAKRLEEVKKDCPLRVLIALPAYNEAKSLPGTLESIEKAILKANSLCPGLSFEVVVGDDGSTDDTLEIAHKKKVKVLHLEQSCGKWHMLRLLLDYCKEADWVVFADAGVVWREDFLIRSYPLLRRHNVLAIAPTYFNPGGGKIERFLWRIERHFKWIESFAGGPISIHGATVFYRRGPLKKTLRFLGNRNWFNDDVVVPLLMRSLYPEGRVEYLYDLGVYDQPELLKNSKTAEFARRKRMVAGNVQWITGLSKVVVDRNHTVGLLALRRVFRLFWAYWALAAAMLVGLLFVQKGAESIFLALLLAATLIFIIFRYYPARVLSESAIASLMAPYYFLPVSMREGVRWR